MKKLHICLALTSFLSFSAFSQIQIDSIGNVGIGTANPIQKMHLVGTAQADVIRLGDTGGNAIYWDLREDASNNMDFDYGGTKVTISSTGSLGVGTSSPAQKLHVFSSGSNVGIVIDGGAAGRSRLGFLYLPISPGERECPKKPMS